MDASSISILLVDDDPAILRIISKWLTSAGYDVIQAGDGRQATAAIEARCPHLLVTDWEMPHMDGLELCRWVRRQTLPHYIYTVFLTARGTSDYLVQGLEAGADDFLRKPVEKGELLARLRSGERVLAMEAQLRQLAGSDPLTGLATQRSFYQDFEKEWSLARRRNMPLSVAMADIDFFKRINDTYGHAAGDEVIRHVARIMTAQSRSTDVVSRYGGEEFCVLLPVTDRTQANLWAERVRRVVANTPVTLGNQTVNVTVSFGVAQRLDDTDSPAHLVDLADQALLVAKQSGRDRVVDFHSLMATAELYEDPDNPCIRFGEVKAKHAMTTIVAALRQDSVVGDIADYFLRLRISSAPVVNGDGKLVGILSEKDVMAMMLTDDWSQVLVKDVMKEHVVYYDEETPVLTIYDFLCRVSIRSVVVVKDERPTGMISRSSLLRWFANALRVPQGVNGNSISPRSRFLGEPVASTIRAIAQEAAHLETAILQQNADVLPWIIGGVSRVQELLNDLLATYHQVTGPDDGNIEGTDPNAALLSTFHSALARNGSSVDPGLIETPDAQS